MRAVLRVRVRGRVRLRPVLHRGKGVRLRGRQPPMRGRQNGDDDQSEDDLICDAKNVKPCYKYRIKALYYEFIFKLLSSTCGKLDHYPKQP